MSKQHLPKCWPLDIPWFPLLSSRSYPRVNPLNKIIHSQVCLPWAPPGQEQDVFHLFPARQSRCQAGWRSVHVKHVCGLDYISLDSSPFSPPPQALLLGLLGLASPLSGSHGLRQGGPSKFSSQILAGTSRSACGSPSRGNLGQWLNRWTSGLSPTLSGPLWPVLKGSMVPRPQRGKGPRWTSNCGE